MEKPLQIVVGLGGGIAAYKTCELIRRLVLDNNQVVAIPTEAALNFVGKTTLEALTGNPVYTSVFAASETINHVNIAKNADVLIIAPATANLIAKLASGIADDLLTNTVLMFRGLKIIAPAMHAEMWANPITQANIAKLRKNGFVILSTAFGKLTSGDIGWGRMMEPAEIAELMNLLVSYPEVLKHSLQGKKVLVSAGGIREEVDPVRFIGNRSSGKQGLAIARVARLLGAEVKVVLTTDTYLPALAGVEIVKVDNFTQMYQELVASVAHTDLLFMAAAVSDYHVKNISKVKLKKTNNKELQITLEENPDILAEVTNLKHTGKINPHTQIIGFAAETGDEKQKVIDYATTKIKQKKVDYLVVNPVFPGNAFEGDNNSGFILNQNLSIIELPVSSKLIMAAKIMETVVSK